MKNKMIDILNIELFISKIIYTDGAYTINLLLEPNKNNGYYDLLKKVANGDKDEIDENTFKNKLMKYLMFGIKNENFVEDIINIFKDFIKLEKFDIERIKFICKNVKEQCDILFDKYYLNHEELKHTDLTRLNEIKYNKLYILNYFNFKKEVNK